MFKKLNINFDLSPYKKYIIWTLLIICSFIVLGVCFSMVSNYYKQQRSEIENLKVIETVKADVLKKQSIKDSLTLVKPYEDNIIKTAANKDNEAKKFNKNEISIKTYSDELSIYNKNITGKITELQKLKIDDEVGRYKSNVINEYQKMQEGINNEIKFMSSKDKSDMNKAEDNYAEFMRIKESNKIVYKDTLKLTK